MRHRNVKPYDDANGWNANSTTGDYKYLAPATDNARQWQGWGTALKPAHEPIVLARKPLIGTVSENVLAHGTGSMNIDATRLVTADNLNGGAYAKEGSERHDGAENWRFKRGGEAGSFKQPPGRWPPNVLLSHTEDCDDKCADDCPVLEMDRQSGISKSAGGRIGNSSGCYSNLGSTGWSGDHQKGDPGYGDEGGASRFFPCFRYHPKTSRKERERGCENLPVKTGAQAVDRKEGSDGLNSPRAGAGRTAAAVRNVHPTVKPVELMKWLVKLVTPPSGVVLDPFTGSGTTGVACVLEGFDFIGFEQSTEYVEIAEARIADAQRNK
jgi:site-specific DNA-methyltransferase (adenine-specific)